MEGSHIDLEKLIIAPVREQMILVEHLRSLENQQRGQVSFEHKILNMLNCSLYLQVSGYLDIKDIQMAKRNELVLNTNSFNVFEILGQLENLFKHTAEHVNVKL